MPYAVQLDAHGKQYTVRTYWGLSRFAHDNRVSQSLGINLPNIYKRKVRIWIFHIEYVESPSATYRTTISSIFYIVGQPDLHRGLPFVLTDTLPRLGFLKKDPFFDINTDPNQEYVCLVLCPGPSDLDITFSENIRRKYAFPSKMMTTL